MCMMIGAVCYKVLGQLFPWHEFQTITTYTLTIMNFFYNHVYVLGTICRYRKQCLYTLLALGGLLRLHKNDNTGILLMRTHH